MFFKKKEVAAPEGNIPENCTETESCNESCSTKKPRKGMFAKLKVMMAAFALMLVASGVTPVLASDTTGTTATNIDMNLANQLIELIKAVNTLFLVFPINIFLIGSLIMLAFRVFRGAKKTATK
ncbi:MAG: hypothetical protein IJY09_06375 [Lachnospiraceae bacterium]|nr:hypothetical protein [Lachnospiraceae bacterium]